MKIMFLGDIMPGGILPYIGEDIIGSNLRNELSTHDIRIATLECAIGDTLEFDPVKIQGRANIIYAPTDCEHVLSKLGIDVVSLANNHVLDLGLQGLQSTIDYLEKTGIQYTGAGANIEEATNPVIIEKDGISIAVLAGCTYDFPQVGHIKIATSSDYGVAPLEDEVMLEKVRYYKDRNNYVIVLAHWGKEYLYFPASSQLCIAKKLIEAGCDLIIGSHPHVTQPILSFHGKKVFFSLGNGLFPDFYMMPPRPIWYPTKEEIKSSKIPVTYDYPFPIQNPVLRIWPNFARIGMIVSSSIKKHKLSSKYKFIYLNNKNSIENISNYKLKLKLNFISHYMKCPKYDEGLRIVRLKRILKSLLRMP